MDGHEFIEFGTAMLKYITEYMDTLRDRKVLPDVKPGYLRDLMPTHAPEKGESWKNIMADLEPVIMSGITHWQSPNFHAYFPTGNAYPSVVAEMLSAAIGSVGFSWISSPAYTELEIVMMDWLGRMLDLPKQFLHEESNRKGGGVIQGSASEATLVALLSARSRTIKKTILNNPHLSEGEIMSKLVAYSSDQSHSSVQKAGMLGGVKMRLVKADKNLRLPTVELEKVIEEDIANGLIPFYVVATLGTTNSLAFDPLEKIGNISEKYDLWLHIDAAYAGTAFVCEEFRYLNKGLEKAHSFNFNPHKWLLINYDCAGLWLRDVEDVVDALAVENPVYLAHTTRSDDFRNYQIPLGRRFRSLKLWFVLRIYGVLQIQEHVRRQVELAKEFEKLVLSNPEFEIVTPVIMGLVCFRLKGESNGMNERLLEIINARRYIHMVPAVLHGLYTIRFVICNQYTNSNDVANAWGEIQAAKQILRVSDGNNNKKLLY